MESISWSYVFGTLLIRFIGVFIVLAILMIGITVSAKIIRYFERPQPPPTTKK
jgi:uncharacterized membrane protein (UPF0182 family)